MSTHESRLRAAKDALANHDFSSLIVHEIGQWDTTESEHFIVLVQAEAVDGKALNKNFHVRFDEQGCIREAYALNAATGDFV